MPCCIGHDHAWRASARRATAARIDTRVGGAAGAYAGWLAERGYTVHLVDAVPRLVEEARHPPRGHVVAATRLPASAQPEP
jgi:2-polyprenyl-3-methyl-5-hydroxy-6-metoxy-1,4-benzoquinol methylase